MALIGSKWAVISAGLSCQTSRQIRRNRGRLERLLGDVFELKSGPYDWVIAGAERIGSAVAARSAFPARCDDIDFAGFRPEWTQGGIYYWHDMRGSAGREAFPDTGAKFIHKNDNLDLALSRDRVIAVVSNTQNNLFWMREHAPLFEPVIASSSVIRLRDALRARASGRVDVMLVTYPDRTDVQAPPEGVHHFTLRPDDTEWGGDNRQWADCFSQLCRSLNGKAQAGCARDVAAQRRPL